jgi:hypothetical protein
MTMTDATTSNSADSAGASAASVSSNESNSAAVTAQNIENVAPAAAKSVADVVRDNMEKVDAAKSAGASGAGSSSAGVADPNGVTAVVGADGNVTYVPNFKYKVAGQEKELDKFWHPLIKDVDSEKKVKELFTKVDAFDFVKGKKEHFETQYNSLAGDYEQMSSTVDRFDQSVQTGDLSSAFRIAGIPKESIFKWVHQQLQYEGLPPEQKAAIDAAEAARVQQYDYESKISGLEKQYQSQAVQARTMQLDMTLMKPEVASFATAWDQNAEDGFTFRDTVAAEARRVWYETQQDISPEKAVQLVMGRFGRFVSTGEPGQAQSPQVMNQQVTQSKQAPPVIPNVAGKATSPIKKVPKSIDDLKALARSL